MKPLAVIAGFGGINAAGRSSSHHYYRRTVLAALDPAVADDTLRALAGLMRIEGELDEAKRRHILEHTLVRGLEPTFSTSARRRGTAAPGWPRIAVRSPSRSRSGTCHVPCPMAGARARSSPAVCA